MRLSKKKKKADIPLLQLKKDPSDWFPKEDRHVIREEWRNLTDTTTISDHEP